MRQDIAQKYESLIQDPQLITFSDIPPDERTETIPARRGQLHSGGYARIYEADDTDFKLQGYDDHKDDFALETDSLLASHAQTAVPATAPDGPDQPKSKTPEADPVSAVREQVSADETRDDAGQTSDESTASADSPMDADAGDLLAIALTQEREIGRRKRDYMATAQRQRILIPCLSCGAWVRIREEQAGRTLRCRNCKSPIKVPAIRRRRKKVEKDTKPLIAVDWLDDVHLHLIRPEDVTLKPKSLAGSFVPADAGFFTDGLALIACGAPTKKKSLFSRGDSGGGELQQHRETIRAHIESNGQFANLPHGELYILPSATIDRIRLVQPLRLVHESMFAGVPVFGEGRIAVYLPLDLEKGQQLFCSMPLSRYREFDRYLRMHFDFRLSAAENGIPPSDSAETLSCFYSQIRVEAVRDLVYYENDPGYELELTGYRCEACGTAVSEAGRAKSKLGGRSGKSITKAKCPKCSGRFGREPLYRIAKAPEAPAPDTEKVLQEQPTSTAETGEPVAGAES